VDQKTSKYTSTKKISFGVPSYNSGTNGKLTNLSASSVPQTLSEILNFDGFYDYVNENMVGLN
jgi:hypothetical protein